MRAAQVVVAVITIALILTLGFQAAIVLLLFLVLSYVLAAILVVFMVAKSTRLEDRPAMHGVPPDDASIPEAARKALSAHRDALVALGFEPRDAVFLAQRSTPRGYLALYRHRGIPASAFSRVLLQQGKAELLSAEVEFEVSYDNGTIAELSNVINPALNIDQVPGRAVQMPHVTDVATLFGYFMKLVTKYERDTGLTERSRLLLPDDKTAGALFEFQLARGHAIQHRAGMLRPTDEPGVWRPTWRAVLLIAGAAISPFREIVRRRLRRQGEHVQRELDAL
jgi:hypothetical protein